ncbi:ABC transporter substrate-binding protein [Haloterrigena alkaliphila]|uniref:ABC transporter substrate-binding protein n=1 Tax=Haloterrigena alkaliphila TaxID=2816475 RepID=A0A8A2VS64_9EURY|nr:ABC transporter substrate-binding protein [Haloterrigena alkaliphila]QSX00879.1 ABC transporter substrate-binding protein [Haloterrigena alkaliphila]
MSNERTWTRRNVLRTSGAIAGISAMAGCIDSLGSSDEPEYTVSMPPVGEVGFDSVPETWAANNGSWADMGIALGQEPPEALYLTRRYHTQYYDDIPDVSVDPSGIDSLWGDGELGVEEFLNLSDEVDVFVMDPNFIEGRSGLGADDVERIRSAGTPFFGNSIFSQGYDWHDYDYLSLYEAFEKLAEVFQEGDRYDAFESLHDEFRSSLAESLPSDDRPEVAILWPQEDGVFLPYLVDEGTSFKHLRDLEVDDALANSDVENFHSGRGEVDYEMLLEVDPEHILLRSEEYQSRETFQQEVVEPMKNHDAGQQLTAVQNDDVYRAGPLYQGPIINLVVTQRLAQRLYGVEEELFDPQAVSDIVNGDF